MPVIRDNIVTDVGVTKASLPRGGGFHARPQKRFEHKENKTYIGNFFIICKKRTGTLLL